MKRIIDISEEEYDLIDNWGTRPYLINLIKNSTPLNECEAENCTNGGMIKAMFPKCEVCEPIVEDDIIHVIFADKADSAIGFDYSWWNAPYKGNVYPKSDKPSGKWEQINKNEINVIPQWKCSECGAEFECFDMDFEYCPNCGAKMEEADE